MNLNSTKVSQTALNIGLLLMRFALGGLMIANHGWLKVINYETLKVDFIDFMGLGSHVSLILAIVAEILCSILLIFGLYTRVALLALIITMLVAMSAHSWNIFEKAELSCIFLLCYVFLFLTGPGEKSIDARMNKRTYF